MNVTPHTRFGAVLHGWGNGDGWPSAGWVKHAAAFWQGHRFGQDGAK